MDWTSFLGGEGGVGGLKKVGGWVSARGSPRSLCPRPPPPGGNPGWGTPSKKKFLLPRRVVPAPVAHLSPPRGPLDVAEAARTLLKGLGILPMKPRIAFLTFPNQICDEPAPACLIVSPLRNC